MLSAVDELIDTLSSRELMDAQESYVDLFDRTKSLSLHLYEHVWGDAGERGQAMVRLQTVYKLHGFSHTASELPDYVPLFCEFLSLIPEKAARAILSDAAPVIEVLRERLAKRGSPYAGVAAALVSLSSKTVDRAALEQITKGALADDDSFEALDRAWEEEPVTFGRGRRRQVRVPSERRPRKPRRQGASLRIDHVGLSASLHVRHLPVCRADRLRRRQPHPLRPRAILMALRLEPAVAQAAAR